MPRISSKKGLPHEETKQQCHALLEKLLGLSDKRTYVYYKDKDGNYQACNKSFANYVGFKKSGDIHGRSDRDFFSQKTATKEKQLDKEVMLSGIPRESTYSQELKEVCFNSTWSHIKLPYMNSKNEVIGIITIGKIENETANIIDEQEKMQLYLENIINAIPGSIYWKDLNGKYLGCNRYVLDMAGLTSYKEIMGKSDYELIWKDTAKPNVETDIRVMKSGTSETLKERSKIAAGGIIELLTTKTPLYNENGDIFGVLGVSLDVSEQEAKRRELLETQKKLAKSRINTAKFKAMSGIGGTIAHEIRTPLAAISLRASGIKKTIITLIQIYNDLRKERDIQSPISERKLANLTSAVDEIQFETESANTFIDMMLVKLQAGNKSIKLETLSIETAILEALKRYPFQPGELDIISFVSNKNDFRFNGNLELFVHVIFNLLKNSLYHVRSNPMKDRRISISIENKPDHVLYFEDNGSGISEDELKKIFNYFHSNTYHGSGLGLAFCRDVIRLSGGKMTCESKLGEYTKFITKFPK